MAGSIETENYVGACVKYTLFIFNFLFWLMGGTFVAIGIWAYIEKDKFDIGGAEDIYDIIFDVSIVIIVVGGVIFLVAFAGCIGALRENIILLKIFSYTLGIIFLVELVGAILVFVFSGQVEDIVTDILEEEGIVRYRDDPDLAALMDWFQEEFSCCGVGEDGYKDWSNNMYFNCSEGNQAHERCAVPYSCCRPPKADDGDDAMILDWMCGYDVQQLTISEANLRIYTEGCVNKVLDTAKDNMLIIGGVVIGLAMPQLLLLFLACLLVRDIEDTRDFYHKDLRATTN